jgi:hypothetical protein
VSARLLGVVVACAALACNAPSGQVVDDFGGPGVVDVPLRRGSVVASTCSLDGTQRAALESSAVKKLVDDVILFCFAIDADGEAQPSSAIDAQAFARQARWASQLGYHVEVGVSLGASAGARGAPSPLASARLRPTIVSSVLAIAGYADGLELDLRDLGDLDETASDDVTAIVVDLASVVRPARTMGILVPATAPDPAGAPQGTSPDIGALARHVDRVRVMTLDYSLGSPGPTIDAGWAVDAALRAIALAGHTPVDVAMPLYGREFGAFSESSVSFAEAVSLERANGAALQIAPSGAPWFEYASAAGDAEEVWFDDAQSTELTLAAWPSTVLPAGVGVVFYGLGSEDPTLWSALVEAKP